MKIDEKVRVTLRGRPFIGNIVEYTDPEDGAVGTSIRRECRTCLMREDADGNVGDDCYLADKSAHQYFEIDPREKLPMTVDGQEVGNYCPRFTDYRCE
jgi:uncharacterized protein YcfJ